MKAFASQFQAVALSVFAALPLSASGAPRRFDIGFTASPPASEPHFTTQGLGYSLELTPNEAVFHTSSVFRMKWLNANSRPSLRGQRVLRGTANYFLGNDPAKWRTHVKRYAEVKYQSVYAGSDLVFHTRTGRLEYDWIVSPGADPSSIQVEFPDADGIRVEANGDLVISIHGAVIRQQRPVIF